MQKVEDNGDIIPTAAAEEAFNVWSSRASSIRVLDQSNFSCREAPSLCKARRWMKEREPWTLTSIGELRASLRTHLYVEHLLTLTPSNIGLLVYRLTRAHFWCLAKLSHSTIGMPLQGGRCYVNQCVLPPGSDDDDSQKWWCSTKLYPERRCTYTTIGITTQSWGP